MSHDPRFTVERGLGGAAASGSSPRSGAVRPAVVLVELFPFGRAKFARELVPLLEAARAAGALDRVQPARHPRQPARRPAGARRPRRARSPTRTSTPCSCTATPRFARLEETFAPRAPLRVPVHYTGFVVRRPRAGARPPRGGASCSAGGGRVGEPLLRAAAEAQRTLWPRPACRCG